MAMAAWYHRDISRVHAEDLLARAGRDGSFLVRDSESVPGAYALLYVCVYVSPQTSQGVQVNCFRTLGDLVLGYQHPHKGLVTPLLYPVGRDMEPGDESSGDDEKPGLVWSPSPFPVSVSIAPPAGLPVTPSTHPGTEVVGLLSEYLRSELPLDVEGLRRGATGLRHLHHTLGTACQGLNSEIDLIMSSLETLAKVFDHPICPLTSAKPQVHPFCDISCLTCPVCPNLSVLICLSCPVCPALLLDFRKTSNVLIKTHIPLSIVIMTLDYRKSILQITVGGGGSIPAILMYFVPHLICMCFYPLDSIVVFILTLSSLQKREAFCQLLQLMKTRHSRLSEPDVISVFVGSWNMGGSPPPRSLQSWVTCCGLGRTPDESTALLPHDIYALGTQENSQGEKEWTEHVKATLHSYTHLEYKQVAVQSLWNMRLAVFVKPEHESRISHVNTASVKTGLGNTLGNKGAVGVSFLFNNTSFGFVNCHQTSGSEKVVRRNQNFADILRLLSLGDRQLSAFDVSLRFTHLFWCGDLNYRLDLDVQDILKHVSRREFDELMCADQLTQERHKRKAFLNFKEEKIAFPPTYRYERGSRDSYLWQKYKTSGVRVNVPSWCDRILWKSYSETHITCNSYGCTDDIFTSDHSPVFATFHIGVTSKFKTGERAWIELEGIEAIVKTTGKAKFFIEFHSSCLDEIRRSTENDSQSCDVPCFLKLGWSSKQLPKLLPIVSDMEYLQDQHLLLCVKSCDGLESYGECCVALRSLIGAAEQFETFLTHRGEEMGSIRGRVRVHVPKDRRGTREKIYGRLACCHPANPSSLHSALHSSLCSPLFTLLSTLHSLVSDGHIVMVYSHYDLSIHFRSSPPPPKPAPSSYTNPAYFIFEGVSVLRRVEEAPPPRRDPQVVWAGDSALQLPKLSVGRGYDRKSARRSDFTEIEIPGILPHYSSSNDHHPPQANSSYQLFPAKNPSPIPPAPNPTTTSHYHEQPIKPQPRKNNVVQDAILPAKYLRNMYTDHSAVIRETPRREQPRVLRGAPETLRELLSTLGLQNYTLGLSLNGWDDLDYFSGITEEDLRAAGVSNPSHRRRILENLPRIWDSL
uniref:phosphatidylinositol-3,4,5-trisphosphate 5-phosphatase n=1 Tax=Salmo trutta TaxID=8032 RepID=A0A674C648_SALTR